MPKIVPSQIVGIIDKIYPAAKANADFRLEHTHSVRCAIIIDLVEQLPEELITVFEDEYLELQTAIAALRAAREEWRVREYPLSKIKGLNSLNPISPIRNVLEKCPDEYPSKETSKLKFIEDKDFRFNLEIDMSNIARALSNSEWKAATVLAGSVIEALLLWVLEEEKDAVLALVDVEKLKKKPKGDLNKWDLENYIEVAEGLRIIDKETATLAGLARGYRNLIHPGREKRLGQKCDRSTAFAAVAAVEGVARDLSSKFEKQ